MPHDTGDRLRPVDPPARFSLGRQASKDDQHNDEQPHKDDHTLTPTPVTIPTFGGLDLRADPQEVGFGGCVDCLNVEFDRDGRVRTRPGSVAVVTLGAAGSEVVMLRPTSFGGTQYLMAVSMDFGGSLAYLDRVSAGGTNTAIGNWTASDVSPPARLGTPTSELFFIPSRQNTTTGNLLRQYNGTTLSTVAGEPLFVAVSPHSNRLIQARFLVAADSPTGANGSESTVFFSDAGAPTTWSANNFVHLQPGDGEKIEAVVGWRDLVFVFKRSNVFVFYGESADSRGNPIFNYRRIHLPEPLVRDSGVLDGVAVAGHDGVYFRTIRGIARTRGGEPESLHTPIDPVFSGLGSGTLIDAGPTEGDHRLGWNGHRLHVLLYGFASPYLFTWDTVTDTWSASLHVDMTALPTDFDSFTGAADKTMFAVNDSLRRYDETLTTDAGSNFASHWTSGFSDLGLPMQPKRFGRLSLWGTGTPTVSVFTDHGSTDSNAAAVTLGTSPAIAEGRHMKTYRGTLASLKMSATSGAWTVNRAIVNVLDARAPR